MVDRKSSSDPGSTTRSRVLAAAEVLLGRGSDGFSMRDLAEEAGVSFATPFNQFGNKGALMLALSERRIASMRERFAQATLPPSSLERVLLAVDIAAAVMLTKPAVNRAVMGAIGAPKEIPGAVSADSGAFWAEALGAGVGLSSAVRDVALAILPEQLAVAFRGVLSFWTAGEFADESLQRRARIAAATALLGFADRNSRNEIFTMLRTVSHR